MLILKHLYENEAFTLQYEDQFLAAVNLFQNSNANFADCIICLQCQEAHCPILTFDKKFAKLPSVDLLAH